jgi:hypothetical protein
MILREGGCFAARAMTRFMEVDCTFDDRFLIADEIAQYIFVKKPRHCEHRGSARPKQSPAR